MHDFVGPVAGALGGLFGREALRLVFGERKDVRRQLLERVEHLETKLDAVHAELQAARQEIGVLQGQNAELRRQLEVLQEAPKRIRIKKGEA